MLKNIVKIIVFIYIIFNLTTNLFAENNKIDSLRALLSKVDNKEKINIFIELSNQLWYSKPQQSKQYGLEALELSKKVNDKRIISAAENNLGVSYLMLSENDSSYYHINKSLEIFKELKDTIQIANNLRIIADIYSNKKDYVISQKYYIESYNLFEKKIDIIENNKQYLNLYSILLNNLASFYVDTEDHQSAIKYFKLAEEIYNKLSNNRSLSIAYFNIGSNYYEIGNIDTATNYLIKSYKLSKEVNNKLVVVKSLLLLSQLYIENQEFKTADFYADKAINEFNNYDEPDVLSQTYYLKARLSYILGKQQIALDYLFKSLELSYKTDNKYLRKDCLEKIAGVYEYLNDYKNANYYFYHWHQLSDSLKDINNEIIINEMNKKFDLGNQEIEINRLKAENEFKHQINIWLYIAISSLILIIILIIILLYNLRKKHIFINNINSILESKNNELAISNSTKDKFFSIIAHDLRGPLGSFVNIIELLIIDKDMSSEERQSFIDILSDSAKNIYALLENLLEWSRSQSGDIKYNPTTFNLHNIAEDNTQLLGLAASNKNITLNNTISDEIDVFADPNLITTVIRNLTNNAIKFSPNSGKIEIGAYKEDSQTIVFVKDNGVGIEPSKLDKLFKITEKVSTVGTNNESGTGLGLIICKEFIDKHNGKIWVESEVGKGSTFSFSIPNSNN